MTLRNKRRQPPPVKRKSSKNRPETLKDNILIRHLAALGIQSFYKRFVKWDRNPAGLPLDPITREGIPPERVIRVIYQTMESVASVATQSTISKPKIKSRVQIFDIEILWMAILKANKRVAINPLTNTRFSRSQFQSILNQAVKKNLIKSSELHKYRLRYAPGFRSDRYTSQYEVNEINLIKLEASQLMGRLQSLLLLSDSSEVEPENQLSSTQLSSNQVSTPKAPDQDSATQEFMNLLNANLNKWDGYLYNLDQYRTCSAITQRFPYLQRYTLVQLAAALGNYQIMVALLETGGEISLPYPDYIYPIQICLMEGHYHLIEPLLLYGGSEQLEWRSPMGTALELAQILVSEVPDIYQRLLS